MRNRSRSLVTGVLLIVAFCFGKNILRADCLEDVIDVPGKTWRKKDKAPILKRLVRHTKNIEKITIHYTAMKADLKRLPESKLRGLFSFSTTQLTPFKKVLWGDVPYHYFIDLSGTLVEARDRKFQPDTNTSYNPDGHVTVVVEGALTDTLEKAQKDKLFEVIWALQKKYQLTVDSIGIHQEYAITQCPGPVVAAAVAEYIAKNRTRKLEACE